MQTQVHIHVYAYIYTNTYMYIQTCMLLPPSRFSRVRLCATPWTAAYQASLSMGFSRQEHWSCHFLLQHVYIHVNRHTQACVHTHINRTKYNALFLSTGIFLAFLYHHDCSFGESWHFWQSHSVCFVQSDEIKVNKCPFTLLSLLTQALAAQGNSTDLGGFIFLKCLRGFPSGSGVKNPPAVQEPQEIWVWVRKIPWKRAWQLTPVVLSEESHGQRSLVSYKSWSQRVGHDWSDWAS